MKHRWQHLASKCARWGWRWIEPGLNDCSVVIYSRACYIVGNVFRQLQGMEWMIMYA